MQWLGKAPGVDAPPTSGKGGRMKRNFAPAVAAFVTITAASLVSACGPAATAVTPEQGVSPGSKASAATASPTATAMAYVLPTAAAAAQAPDDPCRTSADCLSDGRCTSADDGMCVPGSVQDCEKAAMCTGYAKCSFVDGVCATTKADDCQKSFFCKVRGACDFDGRDCKATSETDCRESVDCQSRGHCGVGPSWCVAPTNLKSCTDTVDCKEGGRCALRKGKCVFAAKTDAECAKPQGERGLNPCKDFGLCTARDGFCQAVDDATCQAATAAPKWKLFREGGLKKDDSGFAYCDGRGP